METEEPRKREGASNWVILWYFLPVFIALLYPISMWIKKLNADNAVITSDQKAAFVTNEEYKQPEREAPPPEQPVETRVEYLAPPPMPTLDDIRSHRREKRKQLLDSEKPKWQQFGSTPGLLTKAVEKAMNSRAILSSFFNNPVIIESFAARPTVRPLLDDTQAFLRFLSNSPKVGEFFDNPVIKKALKNKTAVETVAKSDFIKYMLNSPAIKPLMENPEMSAALINKNARLKELAQNPLLIKAARENPQTAPIADLLAPPSSN